VRGLLAGAVVKPLRAQLVAHNAELQKQLDAARNEVKTLRAFNAALVTENAAYRKSVEMISGDRVAWFLAYATAALPMFRHVVSGSAWSSSLASVHESAEQIATQLHGQKPT
jgi:hypothetical protein